MRPSLFLRIASIFALVELFGHTALVLTFVPKHGPQEAAVVAAMKSHKFSFSGSSHTYWDLYFGYCLFVSISLVIESGILWKLAALAKAGSAGIRTLVALMALGEAAYAALMYRYFFITPIVGHSAMTLLLAAALFTLRANPAPSFPLAVPPRESPAR